MFKILFSALCALFFILTPVSASAEGVMIIDQEGHAFPLRLKSASASDKGLLFIDQQGRHVYGSVDYVNVDDTIRLHPEAETIVARAYKAPGTIIPVEVERKLYKRGFLSDMVEVTVKLGARYDVIVTYGVGLDIEKNTVQAVRDSSPVLEQVNHWYGASWLLSMVLMCISVNLIHIRSSSTGSSWPTPLSSIEFSTAVCAMVGAMAINFSLNLIVPVVFIALGFLFFCIEEFKSISKKTLTICVGLYLIGMITSAFMFVFA